MKTIGNDKRFNIGVDLGGTNVKFGISDEYGNIISRRKIRTAVEAGPDGIIKTIAENLPPLVAGAGARMSEINSLGIGIPGTTDSRNGTVVFAPNLHWENVQIVEAIRRACDVPVYIAQDTRAAAWGEYLAGAGKGLSSVATITLGTGTGCGMVIEGKIYNGAFNTAGEFGHQIVEVAGNKCNCGRMGCLEAYAGGLAIVREAKAKIADLSSLLRKSQENVSAKDIFDLAKQGNSEARRISDNVVKYVGIGLVSLVNLIGPELVSISGGISDAPPELLLNPLVEFVQRNAYSGISNKVRICKSPLSDDAPLIGASLLHRQLLPDQSTPFV
jgi:glucokinase